MDYLEKMVSMEWLDFLVKKVKEAFRCLLYYPKRDKKEKLGLLDCLVLTGDHQKKETKVNADLMAELEKKATEVLMDSRVPGALVVYLAVPYRVSLDFLAKKVKEDLMGGLDLTLRKGTEDYQAYLEEMGSLELKVIAGVTPLGLKRAPRALRVNQAL